MTTKLKNENQTEYENLMVMFSSMIWEWSKKRLVLQWRKNICISLHT